MTERILIFLNLLAMAILVGKIVFLSFVTAPVLARTLDANAFSQVVRNLFPQYYALGMVSAAVGWSTSLALGLLYGFESFVLIPATLWLGILAIEQYCRTPLIAKINELSDQLKAKQAKGYTRPGQQLLHVEAAYRSPICRIEENQDHHQNLLCRPEQD